MQNQELLEFTGETKTQNVLDDIRNIWKEKFDKMFPDYFSKNYSKCFSIVSSVKDGEIKNIGMSQVDDLLVTNWAFWFGKFMFNDGGTYQFFDDSGVSRDLIIWKSADAPKTMWSSSPASGSKIKVGNGDTPPTIADFDLTNPLQFFNTGTAGTDVPNGQINIPATIGSTFTDDIKETGLFGHWGDNLGVVRDYLLAHDLIDPIIPVIIGNTINVDYQIILN